MIADSLKALFDLLMIVILTIPIYAIFFGKKSLRHSFTAISTGMKAAPLGCLAYVILSLAISYTPFSPKSLSGWYGLAVNLVLLAIAVTVVCKMTAFFHQRALAWNHDHPEETSVPLPASETKPRFKSGILVFVVMSIATCFLSWLFFPLFIFGCNLNTYEIFYKPVEIPVQTQTTLILTERPLPALSYESAFMLIIDDHQGNRKEFRDFIINFGGGAEIAIYRIASPSSNKQGGILFSNGINSAYLDLDSLELKNKDTISSLPRQFIGIYKHRKLDTTSSDPNW